MRTKTLLVAAAALAAAIGSSHAQTVYSQNVVGYVNTPLPAGQFTLVNTPLTGTTNGASTALSGFQGGETLLTWNGGGYYNYTYQGAGAGTSIGFQSDWSDGNATPPAPSHIPGAQTDTSDSLYWVPQPVLNPGQGYFVSSSTTETNTFTGTVITTNTTTLPAGAFVLVGSAIPVGGDVSTNPAITLTKNFAGGETMLVWNGGGYYNFTYQGAGAGTSIGFQSDWSDGNATPPAPSHVPGAQTDTSDSLYWVPPPQLSVGQGIFLSAPVTETWTQVITNIP
jgi:hypothetical protein